MSTTVTLPAALFIQLCVKATHRVTRETSIEKARLIEKAMKPTGLLRFFKKGRSWEEASVALCEDQDSSLNELHRQTSKTLFWLNIAKVLAQKNLEKPVEVSPDTARLLRPELAGLNAI